MFTPDTLSIWLQEQAGPIAIILLALVGGYAILFLSVRSRRSVLVRNRAGVNEDTFVRHLTEYDFDPRICRETYSYLQTEQNVDFPILPSDLLDEDLGLDTDDVHETITDLLQTLGRENRPGIIHTPISTVEDLVRLLQASPRKNTIAA